MITETAPLQTEPQSRPPRVEQLHTGTFTNRFGETFEQPDTAALQQLAEADPRITYFMAPNPSPTLGEVIMDGAADESEKPTRTSGDMIDMMRHALAEQVAKDFPGRNLIIRGAMTSINGAMRLREGGAVLDTADVVALGEERGQGWFRGTRFQQGSETRGPSIDYLSMQAALEAKPFEEAMAEGGPGASHESVFPTLLVYDAEQLERPDGAYYEYTIPPGNDAVLAAYVMDRPADFSLLA